MGRFDKQFFIRCICEILASMFVQYFGCTFTHRKDRYSFPIDSEPLPNVTYPFEVQDGPTSKYLNPVEYALSWGGAIIGATHAFRLVSGAHISPCVSIASMILENCKLVTGFVYIIMQAIGTTIGFLFAYLTVLGTGSNDQFCCTEVSVAWWKAFVVEIYTSGIWIFAMCSSWHQDNVDMEDSVSLRIGLTCVGAILVGAPYSRSCMNPFRSLVPAIAASYYEHLYVYVVVPVLSAVLIAVAWRFIYLLGNNETVRLEAQND